MTMSPDDNAIKSNSVEDELRILGGEAIETFLDYMVAIEVLDQFDNPILQCPDDGLDLLMRRDELNHLLQSTGPMLVQSDLDHLGSCVGDEHSTLLVVGEFKQLLTQVVSEGICHEFNNMLVGLQEDHVKMLGIVFLKLLLEVPATVLILAQTVDFSLQMLELDIVEASSLFAMLHSSLLDHASLAVLETGCGLAVSLIRSEAILRWIRLDLVIEGHGACHLHRRHSHVH